MSKGSLVTFLVVAVVALSVAVAWMWNDKHSNDITIDIPSVHINK